MNESALSLINLSFSWNGSSAPIFSSIEQDFAPGTITTILGSNGCGKTTLLRCIAHRLPYSGEVRVSGELARSEDFNYLPQDYARVLFDHLTLKENVLVQKGSPNVDEALLSLLFPDESVLGKYPSRCSGGQKQRAVLCRAILDAYKFPVTMLDEPFSQLSQEIKLPLFRSIRDVVDSSRVIVLCVTHDLIDALILGDSVIVMNNGIFQLFDASNVQDVETLKSSEQLKTDVLDCLV